MKDENVASLVFHLEHGKCKMQSNEREGIV